MLLSNVQFYCGRLMLSVATAQSGIVGPLAEVHCCGVLLVRKAPFTVVADNATSLPSWMLWCAAIESCSHCWLLVRGGRDGCS